MEEKDVKSILRRYNKEHDGKEWPRCYICGKEQDEAKGLVVTVHKTGTTILCPKC